MEAVYVEAQSPIEDVEEIWTGKSQGLIDVACFGPQVLAELCQQDCIHLHFGTEILQFAQAHDTYVYGAEIRLPPLIIC